MKYILSIIKADYQQRTRSYSFLITLAVTIYAAYLFVPLPTAAYTTLNVGNYKGVYNSAWVGHVSAMMTTIMLSLYGFFLINSGIKKDIDTEVGLIIATTPISNCGYLLSKLFSNFLVLLTIAGITFAVSIAMFFVRGGGYPFVLADFILPYVFFAFPALFTISALAVVGEVFLVRKNILQYILFFFLFGIIMANVNNLKDDKAGIFIDPFGAQILTNSVKEKVNAQFHENIKDVNLGFIFRGKHVYKLFEWEGITWSSIFFLSRLIWICFAIAIVYFSSFFFHRFDFKQAVSKKKKGPFLPILSGTSEFSKGINVALLPRVVTDYSILPFVKTELLLLIRKGPKWFWLINAGAWISMFIVPLNVAYAYILPVLLFLQVTRLSDIATKEIANRLHYFTWSSYKPMQRMLPSQILAGIITALGLSLPVMLRCIIAGDLYSAFNIVNGGIFIVLLAVGLGILSGGKKLFEILFFFITYCTIEKMPVADYLGAMPHSPHFGYMIIVLMLNVFLGAISFGVRGYQVRHL